jgi:hypothetical protein
MILKTIFLIGFLLDSAVSSDSIEKKVTDINCDNLFIEAEDKYLDIFLRNHNLINAYEGRNQNDELCFHFLGKFFKLIEQYRNKQDEIEDNKKSDVNCDLLFIESEDKYLVRFLIRNYLFIDYEKRNDNYESCFHFLGRFFQLIEQYRNDERF